MPTIPIKWIKDKEDGRFFPFTHEDAVIDENGTSIPDKYATTTFVQNAVTNFTETDPTVPAWAKSPTKPSYTASEVGAIIDYSKQYLTFVALEDSTFQLSTNAVNYSLDNGETWTSLTAATSTPTVTAGNKIIWKAELTPSSSGIGTFSSTGNFNVEGNPMSLLFGDNFTVQNDLTGKNYAFNCLFRNCTLINAKHLTLPATTLETNCYRYMFQGCSNLTTAPSVLPATTLSDSCYYGMFRFCSNLTKVPQLPATILTNSCYYDMFNGCTQLTIPPKLPATTLAQSCYANMFTGCTSLTTTPQLPATTLAQNCYKSMFFGCSSLNYVKCLATDISASDCTSNWLKNVSITGTFVKDPSISSWSRDESGIPSTWNICNNGHDSYAGSTTPAGPANKAVSIPFGLVDSTSTSTAFTATVSGITELRNGVCVYLRNSVITSASGWTLDINGLGEKPVYTTMSAATRSTTGFNINYTMLFIYNEDRVSDGCWDMFYGYYSDSNSIGYQIRGNNGTLPMSDRMYRYRIYFTSADGSLWVPSTTSTSTNATTARSVNQRPINPFGPIGVYSSTSNINLGSSGPVTTGYLLYPITFGYSFNPAGGTLALTINAPVYVKCSPQADGSAIIDSTTPYTQSLPTTEDGYIYIFLGIAYSATLIELRIEHPVYYYKNGAIRLWTALESRIAALEARIAALEQLV